MKKILTILAVMLSVAAFAQNANKAVMVKVPAAEFKDARTTIINAIGDNAILNGYLKDANEFVVFMKDDSKVALVKAALTSKYGVAALREATQTEVNVMLENQRKGLPTQPSQN